MNEAERIAGVYREPALRDGARWDLRNPGNRAILAERRDHMKRVLQRQGWLPLGDRKVLDVGCGGGAELAWFRELFGDLEGKLESVTVIPPLARRLGPLTAPGYPLLAALPPMRSHLLGLLLKRAKNAV